MHTTRAIANEVVEILTLWPSGVGESLSQEPQPYRFVLMNPPPGEMQFGPSLGTGSRCCTTGQNDATKNLGVRLSVVIVMKLIASASRKPPLPDIAERMGMGSLIAVCMIPHNITLYFSYILICHIIYFHYYCIHPIVNNVIV